MRIPHFLTKWGIHVQIPWHFQPGIFTQNLGTMSPAREGSFNANFSPETLNSFKTLCKDQSRQYTKVLERLAELYLSTNGKILTQIDEGLAPKISKRNTDLDKLRQSIEQLETMTSIDREDNNETRYQLQELESRIKAIEKHIRIINS